jgi:DUF218 domain-containing protein
MMRPAFFRRRELWVPTLWGWLSILGLLIASAFGLVRGIYSFLAVSEPLQARVLVVEGWMPESGIRQAAVIYRAGGYEHVVTTGGPISEFEHPSAASYAERARNVLVQMGVPGELVVAVPAPASAQDRSFLNAVMLRNWLVQSGWTVESLDVVSQGPHCRRSRMLYRMAFGNAVPVGMIAAMPSEYDPAAWWRTSVGAKDVLGETISWVWTVLFFHPGPPGSHDEMWAVPEPSHSR